MVKILLLKHTILLLINSTTLSSLAIPKVLESENIYFIPKSSLICVLCSLLKSQSCDQTLNFEKQMFKKFKIPKPREAFHSLKEMGLKHGLGNLPAFSVFQI